MIDSRYEWKKRPQTDQDQTKKLAEALNLSELVAEILINRGYDTKEKAESQTAKGEKRNGKENRKKRSVLVRKRKEI